MMGFLDNNSSLQIINRIYHSMEKSVHGVSFVQFATYLNSLMNGNEEERARLCFNIIDKKKKGFFNKEDLYELFYLAIETNTNYDNRAEFDFKANTISLYLFEKFAPNKEAEIDFKLFLKAIELDSNILEVFTLMNQGQAESIFSNSVEESRLKWYINQTKFIVFCLKDILKEMDSEIPGFGYVNEEGQKKTGSLRFIREMDMLNQGFNKRKGDGNGDVRFDRSPKYRKSPLVSDYSNKEEAPLNSRLPPVHIGNKSNPFRPEVLEQPSNEVIDENQHDLETFKLPGIQPRNEEGKTPTFFVNEEGMQGFSFADHHLHSREDSVLQQKNVQLSEIGLSLKKSEMPEIPEEGSVLKLGEIGMAHARPVLNLTFNQNWAKMAFKLENISLMAREELRESGLLNQRRGSDIKVANHITVRRSNLKQASRLREKEVEVSPFDPDFEEKQIRAKMVESIHESLSGSEENIREPRVQLGVTSIALEQEEEQGRGNQAFTLVRNKILEMLHFSEEILHKLVNEKNYKEKKMKEMMSLKKLQRTSANVLSKEEAGEGNIIFLMHKDWELIINLMIGINKSIRALWDMEEHILSKADFKMKDKFELGYKRTIDHTSQSRKTILFHSYAPYVFADIRRIFGVSDDDYLNSIGSETLINNLVRGELTGFRELFSTGKSGSFFYYSMDGKLVLKTISRDEFRFLKGLLQGYHTHVTNHQDTLLPRFYGMYKVDFALNYKIKSIKKKKLYLCVMNNIFSAGFKIHERYDLKGSTYKRTVGEAILKGDSKGKIAFKDLDFLGLGTKSKFAKTDVAKMNSILKNDCEFFRANSIIDYSLLVGIHFSTKPEPGIDPQPGSKDQNPPGAMLQSVDKSCLYFLGIIDILTNYELIKKKLEYWGKRCLFGAGISCIPPDQYATRFEQFMKNSLFLE
jgi:Ca2+-binding EF-hand superfamily protein